MFDPQQFGASSLAFYCPGCDLRHPEHRPLCPVAVRLTAETVYSAMKSRWWVACCVSMAKSCEAADGYVSDRVRHWRAAAQEVLPETGLATHSMVWDGVRRLFIEQDWSNPKSEEHRLFSPERPA